MMSIGVYHVERDTYESDLAYECAAAMVASAHVMMPRVPVVHFTDLESRPIKGVNEVRRKSSEPMALLRMRHHAGVPGEWLFVDTDVIFQAHCKRVFQQEFDIAVTTRNWPHVREARGFAERMPYNMGVVFSRCPAFWTEVYLRLKQRSEDAQAWMGDQEVFCEVLAEPWRSYRVMHLKGTKYNFPPMLKADIVDWEGIEKAASIVHYKGERRKPMMLERISQKTVAHPKVARA